MLSVPVFTMKGEPKGEVQIDPAVLGGRVRPALIKQAVVAYLDHQRLWSARTKGKSDTEGSTRKLYRQKGTGNARMGQIRTPLRRGGGRTFAKRRPGATKEFPKKMRRMARDSAILAKIRAQDAIVVEDCAFPAPRTKTFASMLAALAANNGCVFALDRADSNVYLSGRNIPRTDVRVLDELNAYDVLRRRRLVFTRPAFERLASGGLPGRAAGGA